MRFPPLLPLSTKTHVCAVQPCTGPWLPLPVGRCFPLTHMQCDSSDSCSSVRGHASPLCPPLCASVAGQALINAEDNAPLSVMKRFASVTATVSSWRWIVVWWRGLMSSSQGVGVRAGMKRLTVEQTICQGSIVLCLHCCWNDSQAQICACLCVRVCVCARACACASV